MYALKQDAAVRLASTKLQCYQPRGIASQVAEVVNRRQSITSMRYFDVVCFLLDGVLAGAMISCRGVCLLV